MADIKVERLTTGVLIREGAGVKLHRYIGVDRTNDYEPLLLLDYFNSDDPLDHIAGFPPHPHRGFETVTYLLEGRMSHEDNKGHKGTIAAGDVQWMTAGKGIIHSEMPSSSGRLHGVQLWLNLPAAEKMKAPRYQEKTHAELPQERHQSGVSIKVIAGVTDAATRSPVQNIATEPLFFDITLPLNTQLTQRIPDDYQAVVLVIAGEIIIATQAINQGVLAKLTAGDEVTIKAERNSQCLLIAARKLHEPIVRHGPFVMNTKDEVLQALDDFRNGRF